MNWEMFEDDVARLWERENNKVIYLLISKLGCQIVKTFDVFLMVSLVKIIQLANKAYNIIINMLDIFIFLEFSFLFHYKITKWIIKKIN